MLSFGVVVFRFTLQYNHQDCSLTSHMGVRAGTMILVNGSCSYASSVAVLGPFAGVTFAALWSYGYYRLVRLE